MSLEAIQAAERESPNRNYILEVRTSFERRSIVVFQDAKYMHFVATGWMRRFGVASYRLYCYRQHDIGGVHGLWGEQIGEVLCETSSREAPIESAAQAVAGSRIQSTWPTPVRFDPEWLKDPAWGGPPEAITYAMKDKPFLPRSLLNRLVENVKCRCGANASREWVLTLSEPTGDRTCSVPLCESCGPVLFDRLAEEGWLSRPTAGETLQRAQAELAARAEKK